MRVLRVSVRFYALSIGLGLSPLLTACQAEETAAPATPVADAANQQPVAAEPAAAKSEATPKGTPAKTSKPKPSGFYTIKETRPSAVCGSEGYAFLWKGYLVPECGGCHYEGNKFNVTAFAQGTNLERSYEVMLNFVDREKFTKAAEVNEFCIKCLLKPEDPLLADIKFFAANPRTCPAP